MSKTQVKEVRKSNGCYLYSKRSTKKKQNTIGIHQLGATTCQMKLIIQWTTEHYLIETAREGKH